MSRYVTHITIVILLLTGLMGLVSSSMFQVIDIATSVLTWVLVIGGVWKCKNLPVICSTVVLFCLFWATQFNGSESTKEVMTFAAWGYNCYFYRHRVLPILVSGLALVQVIYRYFWPYTTFIGEIAITGLIIYLTISLYTRWHGRRGNNNVQRKAA